MKIAGSIAFVTGTNRGIGRTYIDALLERGAKKIYATARNPKALAAVAKLHTARIEAFTLDITDVESVAAAAARAPDVNLLINNAGVNHNIGLLSAPDLSAAREEIETNYLGTLTMCRAFAPVLNANGGGVIVNMLSILARVNLPMMGSYCATKAALHSLTQGVRAELAKQGTLVLGVMPGATDTDMTRILPPPKMLPTDVVRAALDAIEQGVEDVYPGDMASGVAQGLANDHKAVEKQFATYLPG